MNDDDDLRRLARRLRRGPLVPDGAGTPVRIDRPALERLLPHRRPMLLIDLIEAVDLAQSTVRGRRALAADDIGFAGHFPGEPIYPGVLVVEAIGQLGITLIELARSGGAIPESDRRGRVRATRIHHAAFLAPFAPGDTMILHAHVWSTELTAIVAGQAYRDTTLAAYAVSEAYVDE